MGRKFILLVLVGCLVLLPVQIYAYGGGGGEGGSGEDVNQYGQSGNAVGGPPLTFTPPDELDYGIPDSYDNPENTVSNDTTKLTHKAPNADISEALSQWMSKRYRSIEGSFHSAMASVYGVMGSIAGLLKVKAKIAIATMAFIGATAGLIAMAPPAAAALGITIAGAKATAAAYAAAALVTGALMTGAEKYDKSLGEGKSQTEAAGDGLNSAVGKGFVDHTINLNPAFGTIDLIQKAGTGKGTGDMTHEGTTGGTPDIALTSMSPIDA